MEIDALGVKNSTISNTTISKNGHRAELCYINLATPVSQYCTRTWGKEKDFSRKVIDGRIGVFSALCDDYECLSYLPTYLSINLVS